MPPFVGIRLWLLVGLLVLLSACRASDSTAGGKVSIRFSGYAGNPAETALMEQLVADFNRAQDGIHARYEPIPGTYYPKVLTMLASGTAPDVLYLDILYFQPFLAKRKILRPLNDFLATSSTRPEDFIPSLLSAFSEGETIYGIPKDFNTLGLYYNRDSFDRVGLAYPESAWDLARFRQAAITLTRPKPPRAQYGFAMAPDTADRFLPIAEMFGARLFAPDGTCAIASPEGIRAMEFYAGLKLTDHAAIFPSEVGSSWSGDAFGRQNVAMAFEGSWLTPYLQTSFPSLPYGVAQLPRGPAGRSNFLFTVAYVIPQASRHAEAAWKLIEFLTSEESQAQVTFALPSRTAISRKYVEEHPESRPILEAAAYARPYDFGPQGPRIIDRLGVALQEVLLGVKPPEQALRDAAKDIDLLNRRDLERGDVE
ncbi:Multiple sugar-binding protein precursor [compost metagenome]